MADNSSRDRDLGDVEVFVQVHENNGTILITTRDPHQALERLATSDAFRRLAHPPKRVVRRGEYSKRVAVNCLPWLLGIGSLPLVLTLCTGPSAVSDDFWSEWLKVVGIGAGFIAFLAALAYFDTNPGEPPDIRAALILDTASHEGQKTADVEFSDGRRATLKVAQGVIIGPHDIGAARINDGGGTIVAFTRATLVGR